MANITLLNGVSANTTGSGASVTGACAVHTDNLLHTEAVTIQMALADTAADYRTVSRIPGPDPMIIRIDNPGTYYLRAILSGVASGRSGTVTVKACQ